MGFRKLLESKEKCNCRFEYSQWRWVNFYDCEEASIEIEYRCPKCGELEYDVLCGEEAEDWVETWA